MTIYPVPALLYLLIGFAFAYVTTKQSNVKRKDTFALVVVFWIPVFLFIVAVSMFKWLFHDDIIIKTPVVEEKADFDYKSIFQRYSHLIAYVDGVNYIELCETNPERDSPIYFTEAEVAEMSKLFHDFKPDQAKKKSVSS